MGGESGVGEGGEEPWVFGTKWLPGGEAARVRRGLSVWFNTPPQGALELKANNRLWASSFSSSSGGLHQGGGTTVVKKRDSGSTL